MSRFEVFAWQENDVFVATAPSVDIASQGDTIDEAVDNLKSALELYFEDMTPEQKSEAIASIPRAVSTRTIDGL